LGRDLSPYLLRHHRLVGGLISVLLYNLIARVVGSIELKVEQRGGRAY